MKLNLTWRDRDVIDVVITAKVWQKHPKPAAAPKDEGPALRANGHLQTSERARRLAPDTVVFGFGRRENW